MPSRARRLPTDREQVIESAVSEIDERRRDPLHRI
jgi:hypothetical protein